LVSDKLERLQKSDCSNHSLSLESPDDNDILNCLGEGFEMLELDVYLPYWEKHEAEQREELQNSIQYCDLK
jgi:hypothetical protein